MVGDTAYDIEAAQRAGVRCIALFYGGSADGALGEADAIFDTPLALATALNGAIFDALLARSDDLRN